MRDKILKLIYKKLDEVDGSTKFYSSRNVLNVYREVLLPFYTTTLPVERNEAYSYNWLGLYPSDTYHYWSPSGSYKKEDKLIKVNRLPCDIKSEEFDLIDNKIIFEDGEPDIIIYSAYNRYEDVEKTITKNFWGRNYSYKTTITYKFIVNISCGHINFNLSEQEGVDLLNATKAAYQKTLSLKQSYDDKVLDDKLNLRLDIPVKKKKKGKKNKGNE
jgi:hypothetical protein